MKKSQKTKLIVRENLSLALTVISFASFMALGGIIPLWLAVILHEGGTILVGLNSLRLLKK
jgi:cation transport ATPase